MNLYCSILIDIGPRKIIKYISYVAHIPRLFKIKIDNTLIKAVNKVHYAKVLHPIK